MLFFSITLYYLWPYSSTSSQNGKIPFTGEIWTIEVD